MNCPKHPHEKMTLLFTSWVCDVCEPPKKVIPNPALTIDVNLKLARCEVIKPDHVAQGNGWKQVLFGAGVHQVQAGITDNNPLSAAIDFRDLDSNVYNLSLLSRQTYFNFIVSDRKGELFSGMCAASMVYLMDDAIIGKIDGSIIGYNIAPKTHENIRKAVNWIIQERGW